MEHEVNRSQDATPAGRWGRVVGLTALAAVALVGAYVVLRQAPQNGYARPLPDADAAKLPVLMKTWAKPDLTLVVSGQMHGYIGPCGCSKPQYGGLERRYNFVELLRGMDWPVVGLDLGELPQAEGQHRQEMVQFQADQSKLKYVLTMKALDLIGYRATGIGKYELQMPLDAGLVELANDKVTEPRSLAASLHDATDPNGIYHQLNARPYEILADTATPKVGVVSLIGPDLAAEHKKQEKFVPNVQALAAAMQAFAAAKVELAVILYHEYPSKDAVKEFVTARQKKGEAVPQMLVDGVRHDRVKALADYWAGQRKANPAIPPLSLVLSLTEESEPPGRLAPIPGSPTQLIEIGHKGRHVGVVGVFRTPQGLDLKYQLASMGPELETPEAQRKNHPVLALMEDYTKQVKQQNLLAKYPRVPHAAQVANEVVQKYGVPKYVGSEACAGCHQHAFTVWQNTPHAHAFDALEKAKDPAHRQFDGECVVCHTVGFRHPTGYYDLPLTEELKALKKAEPEKFAKKFAKHNENLKHVGCESCHGPGGAHANNPNDAGLYEFLNPYRPGDAERKAEAAVRTAKTDAERQDAAARHKRYADVRMGRLNDFCVRCHDTDNDVNWFTKGFENSWRKIAHPTPRAGNQAAQNK